MKKLSKKLSLQREIVRSLAGADLDAVAGGKPPLTRSGCATECPATQGGCGTTGGPATGGNICLQTELTCFAC